MKRAVLCCMVPALGLLALATVPGMASGKVAVLNDEQLASTSGAALTGCYKCKSQACSSDNGPLIGNCIFVTVVLTGFCEGGCDSYCENYESKSWCNFTEIPGDKCDFSACTQLCPPGTQMVNTANCWQAFVGSCPGCAYVSSGTC